MISADGASLLLETTAVVKTADSHVPDRMPITTFPTPTQRSSASHFAGGPGMTNHSSKELGESLRGGQTLSS